MPKKLVYGVGTNDADYQVQPMINGRQVECLFYRAWKCMLMRCYSGNFQVKNPTYIGCSVCDEWLIFSNFKNWLILNKWNGQHIDKDLIVNGNKVYSPDTCCLIDNATNCFFLDRKSLRGDFMIGVYKDKRNGRYVASCRDPFTKKGKHIGYFDDELSAHLAWKNRKHQYALALADTQEDSRVAAALRIKYAP